MSIWLSPVLCKPQIHFFIPQVIWKAFMCNLWQWLPILCVLCHTQHFNFASKLYSLQCTAIPVNYISILLSSSLHSQFLTLHLFCFVFLWLWFQCDIDISLLCESASVEIVLLSLFSGWGCFDNIWLQYLPNLFNAPANTYSTVWFFL